jgi:hypothetical protein
MVEILFFGQMLFSLGIMYIYGKIKYEEGLRDGIDLQIEEITKDE